MTTPIKIIAHRGGKALGAENSIATMKQSLKKGAHGVELDVLLSFNNDVVVMHDNDLSLTTNGKGNVNALSLEEIQRMRLEDGTPPPSLLQVLDTMVLLNPMLVIDIKHPKAALPAAKIVDFYAREKGYGFTQLIMVSFFHQALAQIHDTYPKIITGASLKEMPESLAACGEYTGSRFIVPSIDIVTPAFVKDAKARGLKVMSWVCDDAESITKAKQLGVEYIITSDPTLPALKP